MRRLWLHAGLVTLTLATLTASSSIARADDGDDDTESVPKDLPRLILDNGRRDLPTPDPDAYRFFLHGEHQIRWQGQRSFTLDATTSAINAQPGLAENSLKQNTFVSHWLRLSPRFQVRDSLEVIGQIDLLTGVLFGQLARDTSADATPRDDYNGFSNVQPRWLYAQYKLPFGIIRIGQQPNHWGMGLLANDGDHQPLFGDYRYGSISERILFATKPGGKDSDFYLALAGDLVFRDNNARLIRGQQAFQGVLAAFYERGQNKLGVFSTFRTQHTDKVSGQDLFKYTDEIDAIAIDIHGKVAVPVPGHDAFFFGEAEAAYIFGSTNVLRTQDQALDGSRTAIRQYGGAAVLGFVHRAWATGMWNDPKDATRVESAKRTSTRYLGKATEKGVAYGDLVAQIELGYASGDADPYDGTQKRFSFDPNHKIGLLLFDEMLRWQTARASTAAQDPLLTNSTRPTPGVDLLPSNGGVYGAQYVNPTFIYRPRHFLDLKAGMVVAQSTSDVVDPYRLATTGSYVNYRGGDRRRKDLGVELDAGIEARFPLDYDLKGVLGAQGGILFPGGAFENAAGDRLPPQWIAVGRLGLLF